MATLSDLLTAVTESALFTRAMAALRAAGVPVDSWTDSTNEGIGLTHITQEAEAETRNATAAYGAAGFLQSATGVGLTLYARSQYQLERFPAVHTAGWWLLESVAAAPTHTRSAGDLTGGTSGRAGLLYVSTTDGTLAPGGKLLVRMEASEAGPEYNLPVGTTVSARTTLVGVSYYLRPILLAPGDSTGNGDVVYAQLGGSAPTIKHVVSGNNTALAVTDDGNDTVIVALETNGSGVAISTAAEVAAAVNAYVSAENHWYAQATGDGTGIAGALAEAGASTWITTQGAVEEPDGAISPPSGLLGRCALRWSTLGCGGSAEALQYWGLALPSGYATSPVTRCEVFSNRLNGTIAGGACTVLVAGPAGALTAADLAAVAANYEEPAKYPLTMTLAVATTTNLTVALTGTVYVLRGAGYSLTEVAALVAATLAAYQADLNIGGQGGKVYAQKVGARIEDSAAGAVRNVALTIAAETTVAYNESVIFSVGGLSYVMVDR